MKLIRLLLMLLLMILSDKAFTQTLICPPNIDFENGNYGYWKFYTGSCCPIITTSPGQMIGRHTLTTGSGVDFYGGFPVVAPNGGIYSLKLGNNNTGAQAERAEYFVHIPPGVNNYSLIYNFAVVFEDPGHSPSEQPRFEVSVFDSTTNLPVPCAQYTYVSGSGLPGFTYNTSEAVWWRGWSTASLDLSGLAGHTIIVSFASGDCKLSGHFGYGYVDLACSLFQISSVVCNAMPTQTFNAPPGFMTYQWFDSTYTSIVGLGQSITIPTPAQNSVYHVVLTPFPGFGCTDTLTSTVTIANATSSVIYQTICVPDTFLGHTTSGIYQDTLMNVAGCDSVRTLNLTVLPMIDTTFINQSICAGDTFLGYHLSGTYIDIFSSAAFGCDSVRKLKLIVNPTSQTVINQFICEPDTFMGHTTSGIYIDSLQNSKGCDSIVTLNLDVRSKTYETINHIICETDTFLGHYLTGTYLDTLTNVAGCDSFRTLNLLVYPLTYSTIHKAICDSSSFLGYTTSGTYIDTLVSSFGCDSIRTLHLLVNTVYYTDTNVTICRGNSYLAGGALQFNEGIYIDTFVTADGCDSVIHTNLTIKDVLFPDLGNDTSICEGESLLLYPGQFNQYLWWDGDQLNDRKTVTNSGTYIVTVSNDMKCFASDTITIITNPLPNVTILHSIKDICRSDTINLYGNGALSYEWYFNDYFNSPKYIGDSINFAVNFQTKVTLIGTDVNNCKNSDELSLFYVPCCGNISVPNAFSPNGDGRNDQFHIITKAVFEEFLMNIYDRWGGLVFQTKNSQDKWDGTYQGRAADVGNYFYLIRAKCYEEKNNQLIKGDVMLIR